MNEKSRSQSKAVGAMAIVTTIAVLVAGYALYQLYGKKAIQSAEPVAISTSGDQQAGRATVAAWVNQHAITVDYVNQQIATLPVGQQTAVLSRMDKFVESLIQEETLFQSMLIRDFEDAPKLREDVKTQVVNYLIDKHVTNGVVVSEAMIKTYYDNNQSTIREEHVAASHILLATKEQCEQVLASIDSLETFRHIAKEQSLDKTSAVAGGEIGLFMNHSGDLGFEEHLFDMKIDEMRIFDGAKGCHVVRVTDHVVPPLPPLDEVRDRITELLERRGSGVALQSLLERSAQGIEVTRLP